MGQWSNNRHIKSAQGRHFQFANPNAIEEIFLNESLPIAVRDALEELEFLKERQVFSEKWHCKNVLEIPVEYIRYANVVLSEIQKSVLSYGIEKCSFDDEDSHILDIAVSVKQKSYILSVDLLNNETFMSFEQYIYHGSLYNILHILNHF